MQEVFKKTLKTKNTKTAEAVEIGAYAHVRRVLSKKDFKHDERSEISGFKAGAAFTEKDLKTIAWFKRIVKNYLKMQQLLKQQDYEQGNKI